MGLLYLINNQHYAHICTIAVFYIPASTCFGISLPSSGSFWIRLSYMEIQIDLVLYYKMLVKWPVCFPAQLGSATDNIKTAVLNY
jgi:hypothetical protein